MADNRVFSERYVKIDAHLAALEKAAVEQFWNMIETFAYGVVFGAIMITVVVVVALR